MVEIHAFDFGELPQKKRDRHNCLPPFPNNNVSIEESTPALYHRFTQIQAGA